MKAAIKKFGCMQVRRKIEGWAGGAVQKPPALVMVLVGCLLIAGCKTASKKDQAVNSQKISVNTYSHVAQLPPHLKRVAVLPLNVTGSSRNELAGRDTLGPVLWGEFSRAGRFEVVQVTAEELRTLTGRPAWDATDSLPRDFFELLRRKTGCDAVLFANLTEYAPFPPLAVGWRMSLVDAEDLKVLWAADQVFDASDKVLAKAACKFRESQLLFAEPVGDSRMVLTSPRYFGQFTAAVLAASLPE